MPDSVIRIVGHQLPGRVCGGHTNVHVGIQRKTEVIDLVRGDADAAMFNVPVTVAPDPLLGLDYRGPYIHGPRGRRFVYLSWGEVDREGRFAMLRRAKINFTTMPEHILRALADGCTVSATMSLTGRDGAPLCASIPDSAIEWHISDATEVR